MATRSVGALRVMMEAAHARYTRDMGKGRKANDKFNRGAQRGFRKSNKAAGLFTGGIKRMIGMAVVLAGPAALGALISKSLDAADNIAKMSDASGISTDAMQELTHAADLVGISTDTLQSSLTAFAKKAGEAKNDTGSLYTILKKMDEQLLDNVQSADSTEEALDHIMRAAADISDPMERAALMAAAFGRTAGSRMALLVKNGTASLADMRQEARDLGLVMDEDLLRGAESAKDALARMGSVLKTKLMEQVLKMAPAIETLATKFVEGLPGMLGFAREFAEFIGLIDKSEADKLGEQIEANNVRIEASRDLLKDLKEQVLPGLEFVTPKQVTDIKNLEDNIRILEERNAQLLITLGALKDQNEATGQSEKDLTGAIEGNTTAVITNEERIALLRESLWGTEDAVGANTAAWRRHRDMLALMAKKEYPDISAAMRATEARMEKLRGKIGDTDDQTVLLTRSFDSFEDSMARSIVSGGDLGDIFKDLIREMGAAIIKAKILKYMDWMAAGGGPGGGGGGGSGGDLLSIGEGFTAGLAMGGPVGAFIGAGLGWLFEKGGVFKGGRVTPFGGGGIVSTPTFFPMANGVGLMGEKTDEAIMPLARMSSGALGVQAIGGGSGSMAATNELLRELISRQIPVAVVESPSMYRLVVDSLGPELRKAIDRKEIRLELRD